MPDTPESSFTEWGVRWADGGILDDVDEPYARSVQRGYADRAVVVTRTVTRTAWREASDSE